MLARAAPRRRLRRVPSRPREILARLRSHKQAALINEEETNLENSTKRIEDVLLTIATIPLQFVPFLSFLGYGLLLNWLRRRFSAVE
jgi:hypothetical protein